MTPPRKRIAVIASRVPIPRFENGSTLRLYPVLEYLASRHDTGLLLTADRRQAVVSPEKVEAAFSVREVRSADPGTLTPLRRRLAALAQMVRPPFPHWDIIDPSLGEVVPGIVDFLRDFRPDAVLWYAGPLIYFHAVRSEMGPSGPRGRGGPPFRTPASCTPPLPLKERLP